MQLVVAYVVGGKAPSRGVRTLLRGGGKAPGRLLLRTIYADEAATIPARSPGPIRLFRPEC